MAGERVLPATHSELSGHSGLSRSDAALVASEGKAPRTERGRKTLRAILDAAAIEFGEKGFHEASISGITRRAGVALGSFYTYFDSKDAVFRALVRDMSDQVRDFVGPAISSAPDQIAAERAGLREFIAFVRGHKEIYRIIDESEFVDPESGVANWIQINVSPSIVRRISCHIVRIPGTDRVAVKEVFHR